LIESFREVVAYAGELGLTQFEHSNRVESPFEVNSAQTGPAVSLPSPLLRNAEVAERQSAIPRPGAPANTAKIPSGMNSVESEPLPTRTAMKEKSWSPPVKDVTLFEERSSATGANISRSVEGLDDIRSDIGNCTRCTLCEERTNIVHSEGNPHARLMFVGEAPGADEDAQSRPFVGRAGQLLTKIIEAIGMTREEVFIGNVNRCRPPMNRQPTITEAETCRPFLLREIAVVKPEVIVVMGNTAMRNLLDTKVGITKLRGTFQDLNGIKVMPTFHPAYLLRDPSKKRETWDDMKKVRDYLDKKIEN
jgi:uracil-DNA glycosylase family 4